jgi:cytochrome c oxidase subunit IV
VNKLMRVSLSTFVVSLGVWALIAVRHAVIADYLGGRYLDYGSGLLRTIQIIAVDLAIVAGLVMIALLVHRAWERLDR